MPENEVKDPSKNAGGNSGGVSMPPFTVEFGDDNGRTITLNTLRLRLRGTWSIAKLMSREGGGRAIGEAMSGMPNIPGMRCKVEPRHSRVTIFDPLENEPDRLQQMNRIKERFPVIGGSEGTGGKWKPNETVIMDGMKPDEFKSLVLDLVDLAEGRMLMVVEGRLPSREEAEMLKGRKLYDPWSSSRAKPTYAEDEDAYYERIISGHHNQINR